MNFFWSCMFVCWTLSKSLFNVVFAIWSSKYSGLERLQKKLQVNNKFATGCPLLSAIGKTLKMCKFVDVLDIIVNETHLKKSSQQSVNHLKSEKS